MYLSGRGWEKCGEPWDIWACWIWSEWYPGKDHHRRRFFRCDICRGMISFIQFSSSSSFLAFKVIEVYFYIAFFFFAFLFSSLFLSPIHSWASIESARERESKRASERERQQRLYFVLLFVLSVFFFIGDSLHSDLPANSVCLWKINRRKAKKSRQDRPHEISQQIRLFWWFCFRSRLFFSIPFKCHHHRIWFE